MVGGMVSQEERLWGMLAHLLALLGYVVWLGAYVAPLVVYLAYKERSRFVAFHALQSLFFQLLVLAVGVGLGLVTAVIGFLTLGLGIVLFLPVFLLLGVAELAYVIYAAVRAYNGEFFEYIIVGRPAREIVGV